MSCSVHVPLNNQFHYFSDVLHIEMSEENKPKFTPSVCKWHDEDEYTIEIDLPGVSKKNVDVGMTATGFCVTRPRKDLVYSSCYTLAFAIDPDKAKAKFENGLLRLTLPFKEHPTGKKLVVEYPLDSL